ncbi:FAD-dependent monooxygenase [Streptomyces sp. NPDC059009]|uniref:FAD-dependent monooxygenase n=1 Tax=Streptomyces sp. NPDC059009 TaxID=3346694 RepID=UPI0036872E2D
MPHPVGSRNTNDRPTDARSTPRTQLCPPKSHQQERHTAVLHTRDGVRPMNSESQVLVVGAGPTGLVAATALARRGVDVRLVERRTRHDPHAKAITLWPRAVDALTRLGAGDHLRELALPLVALTYHANGRKIATINFPADQGRFIGPISLPQSDTEHVLRTALHEAGAEVEYDTELTGLTQQKDCIEAELSTGQHRAQWALGCDGFRSPVREAIGTPFEGAPYSQVFGLVDGHWDTPLTQNHAHYFMSPHGVLVVVGLPNSQFRAFVTLPAQPNPDEDITNLVAELAAERCPVPIRLEKPIGQGFFGIQRRIARTFRTGRVLLAGDAAHVHSPAGGQGINTGILDADEAAWRLAGILKGTLPQDTLDQWARERRHVATQVVSDTDRQTRLWTATGWRRAARDVTARVAERYGLLDRLMAPRMAQLDLVYPTDPATRHRSGLTLGSYVPNLPRPGGGSLHDLLHPDHSVVLPLEPALRRTLRAGRSRSVLVRPDGVVAALNRRSVDAQTQPLRHTIPRDKGSSTA